LGNVLVNDDNPANLTTSAFGVTLVTPLTHGSLTTFSPDGSYTYVPAAGDLRADSFPYRIYQPRNSGTCSNMLTVALNVYDPAQVCTQGTDLNLLQNSSFTLGKVGFTIGYALVATPSPSVVPNLHGASCKISRRQTVRLRSGDKMTRWGRWRSRAGSYVAAHRVG
jgi:hypothetical protein